MNSYLPKPLGQIAVGSIWLDGFDISEDTPLAELTFHKTANSVGAIQISNIELGNIYNNYFSPTDWDLII